MGIPTSGRGSKEDRMKDDVSKGTLSQTGEGQTEQASGEAWETFVDYLREFMDD